MAFEDVLNLAERGKFEEAMVLAKELPEGEREKAEAFLLLQQGHLNKALDKLLKLYYTQGHSDDIARMIAHAFIRRMDFATAKDFLERVKDKELDDYFWLFVSYLFIGDPREARVYLDKARELDRKRAKALTMEAYKLIVLPVRNLTENEKRELLRKLEAYFK